jgi:hypothetical protein
VDRPEARRRPFRFGGITTGGTDLTKSWADARWTGVDMVRLEDGLLVELRANADGEALWEQLTESPEQDWDSSRLSPAG